VHRHDIPSYRVDRLVPAVGGDRASRFGDRLARVAETLAGRRLVTVTGDDRRKGGVYEIVRGALPYLRGVGIDVLWLDLSTQAQARPALEFFHVLAHGRPPSAHWRSDLAARTTEFGEFGRAAAAELMPSLRPTDFLVMNDTQTAPVAGRLNAWHERLVWHAHIGTGDRNELVDRYWDVVGPSVSGVGARVFYRPEFAPEDLRDGSVFASPGVDPSSLKNTPMELNHARAVLGAKPAAPPLKWVGEAGPTLGPDDIVGVQLSRWDPLKDMAGACRVFCRVAERVPAFRGMVVGPSAQSAAERAQLKMCVDTWRMSSHAARSRVYVGVIHDCGTKAHDRTVQMLQSAADIIIQKSVQEGFGLTVTEAMLRGKPVVATAVGGIPLQLRDNRNGTLVAPGANDERWVDQLLKLVTDADLRVRLGAAARADALDNHTVDRHLSAVVDGVMALFPAHRWPSCTDGKRWLRVCDDTV